MAIFPADCGGKKETERHHAKRRAHVLIGDGAADGGLVDPNLGGGIGHGEGAKGGGSFFEIVGLSSGDHFQKFLQGLLAPLKGLQEKAGGADPLLEIGTGLLVGGTVSEEVFIKIADPEPGQEVSLQLGNPAFTVPGKRRFGTNHQIWPVGGVSRAGAGGKSGDGLGGGQHGVNRHGEGGGNFGELPFAEEIEMFADDAGLEGIIPAPRVEL